VETHGRPWLRVIVAALAVAGCTALISQESLETVDREVRFKQVLENPSVYKDTVVLGGVIVGLVHKKEGSLLEVYQTALNRRGKPVELDSSEGRFLALYQGLLESQIYRKGRRVTLAGTVQGSKVRN
jgi:outer membrane lipoprotein